LSEAGHTIPGTLQSTHKDLALLCPVARIAYWKDLQSIEESRSYLNYLHAFILVEGCGKFILGRELDGVALGMLLFCKK
jgi:hypothetical protein